MEIILHLTLHTKKNFQSHITTELRILPW